MNNLPIWLDPQVLQYVGVSGFLLYVTSYALLTMRLVSGDQVVFFILNAFAAGLVLVGLLGAFNLASVLIQVFWVVISLVGVTLRLRERWGPGGRCPLHNQEAQIQFGGLGFVPTVRPSPQSRRYRAPDRRTGRWT